MKCLIVKGEGVDTLEFSERKEPVITDPYDVLVEVRACSLNYRDLMVARGQYGADKYAPFIAVSDMAGVVKAVGSCVTALKSGDRVLNAPFRHWPAGRMRSEWARTFVGGAGVDGVLAEQIVYPADSLVKIPDFLSFAEASTFTIAGLTAWAAIVTHGRTQPGEWVLVHGTGGVSIFAAQLAKLMGARVIMTTGHEEKKAFVKKVIGVDEVLDYKDTEWPKKAKQMTSGCGVDVVVEVAGGEGLSRSLQACNYGARVAVVGGLDGFESKIRITDLLSHQITMKGIFMESTQELRGLMKAVEAHHLKPVVDKIFPFKEAISAYKHMEGQKHIGKIVIEMK